MYNIFLSLFITITLLAVMFFLMSRKNKRLKLKHYVIITICAPFLFLFILFGQLIFFPLQFFSESDFEKTYYQVFNTELPSNTKYIATKYKQEPFLINCTYWTARIQTNSDFFNNFHKELEGVYFKKKEGFIDVTTGKLITSSFKTGYMSGYNYEVDFFDDRNTIRIYIIDCP